MSLSAITLRDFFQWITIGIWEMQDRWGHYYIFTFHLDPNLALEFII